MGCGVSISGVPPFELESMSTERLTGKTHYIDKYQPISARVPNCFVKRGTAIPTMVLSCRGQCCCFQSTVWVRFDATHDTDGNEDETDSKHGDGELRTLWILLYLIGENLLGDPCRVMPLAGCVFKLKLR